MIRFLSLFLFCSALLAAEPPLLFEREVKKSRVTFHYDKELFKNALSQPLTLTYPEDVDLDALGAAVVNTPGILNMISYVWISGQNFRIDVMDRSLYESMKKVKVFFQLFYPNTCWDGELEPDELVDTSIPSDSRAKTPATLFTSGVDSWATLASHWEEKPRLIHIVDREDALIRFHTKEDLAYLKRLQGNESSLIYGNFESFLNLNYLSQLSPDITNWRIGAHEGLGWVGIVYPLLVAKGHTRFYIPSTFSWQIPTDLGPHFPDAIPLPMVDNQIQPGNVEVVHDRFDLRRVDKIPFLVSFWKSLGVPKARVWVCFGFGGGMVNCCRCEKCYRTILNFLVNGIDPRPYGFHVSAKRILPKIENFYHHCSLTRVTYWMHKEIQDKIRENKAFLFKGNLGKHFREILNIDLEKHLEPSSRSPRDFSWEELAPFVP